MAMITKSLCFSFIILASFATLFSIADGRRFYIGGNGVWGTNPQENYKTWAGRNRFQVNDTLYFKYAKGADSVQQVMKADFDGCNIKNPIKHFDNGETEVTLDRSGPFYFVSGNEDHCKKGQKLVVVVLAVRNHTTGPISPAKPPKSPSPASPIAPAKPPSTAQPPRSPSPAKPPTTAQPPKSPSPVSPAKPPTKSQPPKSSVSPTQPPKSPSPVSHSPSHSPASSPSPKSPSPSTSPTNPPKSSPSPDQAPTSQPPEQTTPSTPSPSDSAPSSDNATAPAPSPKSSASGKAVTSVMATLLTGAFTVFMCA